jgi:hypothetical protein
MKIYVASSWRNTQQPTVVEVLRQDGHEVYDYKNPSPGDYGFEWSEIDPNWQAWTPDAYLKALDHPLSVSGFNQDMDALRECDACVMVMPCGPSASMELGWAAGAGKHTLIYIPATREPDLMIKMADFISTDLQEIRSKLLSY